MSELGDAGRLFAELDTVELNWGRYEQSLNAAITGLSGVDVSLRQSRILAGFWLLHHVHQVHAWYATRDGGVPVQTSFETPHVDVPVDRETHMRYVVGDPFAWRRRGEILAALLESGDVPNRFFLVESPGEGRATSLRSHMLDRATPQRRNIWISHPYLKLSPRAALLARMRSRQWAHWTDLDLVGAASGADINMQQRISMCRGVSIGDVESLVCATIPLYLPLTYGEALPEIRGVALKHFTRKPAVLFTANALQYHLGYQVFASEWCANGTRLAAQQHGGHTGIDARHALEDLEARSVDRYYTFGWVDDRSNVRPLPTASPLRADSSDSRRLLVMSVEVSDAIYRLQPFCLPEHAQACFAMTRTFLDELGVSAGFNPVVRSGEREHALIGASVPRDDARTPGTVSASASGLVVHNYLGTSWLETLAMNVPTLCIVPPNIHAFRAAAQPHVDALRAHGVIHDDPRAAARFVRSLGGDARAWWRQDELQADRARFVATYANYSDDWLDLWREELTDFAE